MCHEGRGEHLLATGECRPMQGAGQGVGTFAGFSAFGSENWSPRSARSLFLLSDSWSGPPEGKSASCIGATG